MRQRLLPYEDLVENYGELRAEVLRRHPEWCVFLEAMEGGAVLV